MRIPGFKTLRTFAGPIGNRLSRPPLILLYHRVTSLESDPWSLCVSPENFRQQLEVLREWGRILPLADLVRLLDEGRLPRRSIVITFDDGYSDFLHEAKPLLERFGCPATLFVTTGAIEAEREFWWDELEDLLLGPQRHPAALRVELLGTVHEWKFADEKLGLRSSSGVARSPAEPEGTAPDDVYRSLYQLLRPLSADTQEHALCQLREQMGRLPRVRSTHRALTSDELSRLARDELVEIGSHTVSHALLAAQPMGSQRNEIEASKRRLEQLLCRRVESFAYPHGGRNDFSSETAALVRAAGFRSACAAFAGVVRKRTDPYGLPRFGVENWDGDAFSRRLEGGFS